MAGLVEIAAHLHPFVRALSRTSVGRATVAIRSVAGQAMRTLAGAASDEVRAERHRVALGSALTALVNVDTDAANAVEAGRTLTRKSARLVDA